MSKSGAAAHTLPKCKFFNQLQFLHEKVTNCIKLYQTVSNFSATTNMPEISLPSPASSEESRSNNTNQQQEPPLTPVGQESF